MYVCMYVCIHLCKCISLLCLFGLLHPSKGVIQWVGASSAKKAEVRLYNYLFTKDEPTDEVSKL